MPTKPTMMITAAILLAGCAPGYPPGSPKALNAAQHKALMRECMSARTEDINEMAMIDPTYIYRHCRAYADARAPRN